MTIRRDSEESATDETFDDLIQLIQGLSRTRQPKYLA